MQVLLNQGRYLAHAAPTSTGAIHEHADEEGALLVQLDRGSGLTLAQGERCTLDGFGDPASLIEHLSVAEHRHLVQLVPEAALLDLTGSKDRLGGTADNGHVQHRSARKATLSLRR